VIGLAQDKPAVLFIPAVADQVMGKYGSIIGAKIWG